MNGCFYKLGTLGKQLGDDSFFDGIQISFFDRRATRKKTVLNAQLLVQKKDGVSVVHIKEEEEEDDLCLPLT